MRNMIVRIFTLLGLAAALLAGPALAQDTTPPPDGQEGLVVDVVGGQRAALPIAVPYMPTPQAAETPAGPTPALGQRVAEIVATDLANSGLFTPIGPRGLRAVSFPQVTSPDFGYFSTTGAQNLVQGFVQANANGTLTIGCYLYDVAARSELTRQGYVVQPSDWRRAAHRCADTIYSRLTGEGGYFDSRVVFVAESGTAVVELRVDLERDLGVALEPLSDRAALTLRVRRRQLVVVVEHQDASLHQRRSDVLERVESRLEDVGVDVDYGRTRDAAEAWVRDVDEPNARLIERTRARADRVVRFDEIDLALALGRPVAEGVLAAQ